MDDTTRAVRAMYEQFPYPAGAPMLRYGSSVHLLLSYGKLAPPARRLRALDAGCGRGVGAIGHAVSQPEVDLLAVDINRVGLADAEAQAKHRGIKNVRFQEVDLMTLHGLDVPDGGFDVIYSSGVIHHLSNPTEGLRKLAGVLAPHGILKLMVYGRIGREPLYRMQRAVDFAIDRERPLSERLTIGREIARAIHKNPFAAALGDDVASVPDVEFVDRYLHVHERSYDVGQLFDLIEEAGLRFLRWAEPEQWSVDEVLPKGGARIAASRLTPMRQFQLIEQLCDRPKLELVLCKPTNDSASLPTREELPRALLAVNPEASLVYEKRNLRGTQRIERITVKLRSYPPTDVPNGPGATILLLVADQTLPFRGEAILEALAREGVSRDTGLAALEELVKIELLVRLHDSLG